MYFAARGDLPCRVSVKRGSREATSFSSSDGLTRDVERDVERNVERDVFPGNSKISTWHELQVNQFSAESATKKIRTFTFHYDEAREVALRLPLLSLTRQGKSPLAGNSPLVGQSPISP